MEGWCRLVGGAVVYDGSDGSPSDAWWCAYDEGRLDRWLVEGGGQPNAPPPPNRWSGDESLTPLVESLAARFDEFDIAFAEGALRLASASADGLAHLRRAALTAGLHLPGDDRHALLRVWDREETRAFVRTALRFGLKHVEARREASPEALKVRSDPAVHRAEGRAKDAYLDRFIKLEAAIYEPARRDDRDSLARAFDEGGIAVVAVEGERLLGFALGVPLESESSDGPRQDLFYGAGNTLYVASATLAVDARGRGLGLGLKAALCEHARRDGYRFVTSRNRVGHTAAMTRVNRRLGAYEVARYEGQYGGAGMAAYLRMAAGPPRRPDLAGASRWSRALVSGAASGAVLLPSRDTGLACSPAAAPFARSGQPELETLRAGLGG